MRERLYGREIIVEKIFSLPLSLSYEIESNISLFFEGGQLSITTTTTKSGQQ